MTMSEPQILLTNDDGIQSPGLWAAAEALDELGFVTVIAPREQASGTGRSIPFRLYDGHVKQESLDVNGKTWTVHAIGGTPAMAVLYGILKLMLMSLRIPIRPVRSIMNMITISIGIISHINPLIAGQEIFP